MGELIMCDDVNAIIRKNAITEDDVLMLRRTVYKDGIVSKQEADKVFALDRSCFNKCDAWTQFFIESLSDYVVHNADPKGYVSDENARWVIRAISVDDIIDTKTEIEFLLEVITKAQSVPGFLSAFALRQVAHAVLSAEGVFSMGRTLRSGVITASDVDMLRRIVFANAGPGGMVVSREEAQVLFDLNDATQHSQNDPSWSDFFAKAIGNSLLASSVFQPVSAEIARQREDWLEDTSVNVTGFMQRMGGGFFRGFAQSVLADTSLDARIRERNNHKRWEAAVNEQITDEECAWLVQAISRDGVLHENEKAVLRFLKKEAASIPPGLQPLMESVH